MTTCRHARFICVILSVCTVFSLFAGCAGTKGSIRTRNNESEPFADFTESVGSTGTENETEPTAVQLTEVPETSEVPVGETETAPETESGDGSDDTPQFSEKQQNAINMLNYLTVMTQQINMSKNSRLFLEETYDALINNVYPNAIDGQTEAFLTELLTTISEYRMLDVKRERLEYLHEQAQAQAIWKAVRDSARSRNASGTFSISEVNQKQILKTLVSLIPTAVDAGTSYAAYKEQADLQYLKDGWELDDEETKSIDASRQAAFRLMISITNEYDIPGEYALNENAVKEFVKWKNETNVESRIEFFESSEQEYREYGGYWLTLAESYYENKDYANCLRAIERYEGVTTQIFRKDYSLAKVLPLGIIAAKETQPENSYAETAESFCRIILDNSDLSDSALRYYVAQVYIDLSAITGKQTYLEQAYEIAMDTVNSLVREQRNKNAEYLADVAKADVPDGSSKRAKQEIKDYNKMLTETRKTELPPVDETLRLNCELLFSLGEILRKPDGEWTKIDRILHENGEALFLNRILDNQFRRSADAVDENSVGISFDGERLSVPAIYLTDSAVIRVSVQSAGGNAVIDDWTIEKVDRPKNAAPEDFAAVYTSQKAKEHKYLAGDTVTIQITPFTPGEAGEENTLTFTYQVVGKKVLLVFDGITFERITAS